MNFLSDLSLFAHNNPLINKINKLIKVNSNFLFLHFMQNRIIR